MVTPFLLLEDAIDKVYSLGQARRTETVPVSKAFGKTLAKAAYAKVPVPPFHRAMMDGYAVRASDTAAGQPLQVVDTVAAGSSANRYVGKGEAVRIMTGAPIPDGADAVARFEWCDEIETGVVAVKKPVAKGESVQPAGHDCDQGSEIVAKGTRLNYPHLALLQSCGTTEVEVYRAPAVAILVTGSELVQNTSTPLARGQIYGCNDILIRGAVESCGGTVQSVVYVPDEEALVRDAIKRAASQADCVITTGGVSVGDYDYVPGAVQELGSEIHIQKVWMRPGTPFLAATLGNSVIFGLSGNPAACTVQFEVLVRAYFDGCRGIPACSFPSSGILAADVEVKPIKHARIVRASASVFDGQIFVDASISQSPGVLSSFVQANCLVRIDESGAKQGTVVPLQWLR